MRLLCVVLVLVSGAHLAIAQENAIRGSLEFVGCYELHVVGERQTKTKNTEDLFPRRFQLVMRPSADKVGFAVRTLDPKVADSSLMASMSSWNANLDGTLRIVWSTGYVGYGVRLKRSGPELRGTAHYFTDTDPFPPTNRDLSAVAQRVECKVSEK
jgi:hypothetical protein